MDTPCQRWLLLLLLIAFAGGCQQSSTVDSGEAGKSSTAEQKADGLSDAVIRQHDEGVALMGQFDYAQAHDAFEALVDSHPKWLDVKVDLAIAKLNRRQENDVENAESLLEEVIEADATNLRAKYCRAILLLYAAEPDRSLKLFQAVAEADPTDAYAIYYSGQCLLDTRQYEAALEYFERAQLADPYLRSAYYGAFQTLQRLKRPDEAKEALALFQKLADNPQARSAEIKYSRMGPKAEAQSITLNDTEGLPNGAPPVPPGSLFAESVLIGSDDIAWAGNADAPGRPSATACDINGDGLTDLFLASATTKSGDAANIVLERSAAGWIVQSEHPLCQVTHVNAPLWGDFDNDSLIDVYLCRQGTNQLWRQVAAGEWEDVTDSTKTAGGDFDTVDGALFDADHDGDLDIFLVNRDGANELLNNNLDGTFRAIGAAQGIASEGKRSVGVVVADLDSDRDADLIVLNEDADHDVFFNDRLWNYSPAKNTGGFPQAAVLAAVAADTDADGHVEIITSAADGVTHWRVGEEGDWESAPIACDGFSPGDGPLAVQDMNGDGRLDLIASTAAGWAVLDCFGGEVSLLHSSTSDAQVSWGLANLDAGLGFSVVAAKGGGPQVWSPGPGRHAFADVLFTGKENKADQMRSNASGIGIQAAARVAGRWTALQTFRDQSGPGQSRQPIPVGLGTRRAIDFVKLLWPDGLFQTELGLVTGEMHRVEETQRQVSSCPVLFVWNGETHEFVSDVLGVGGLGFNGGRGEYHPPRPWENLMLPADLLQPTSDNRYRLKIGEPMEEACYMDAIRLVTYDLPDGWHMTMDERQAVSEPFATGKPIFYRETIEPVVALDTAGDNVLSTISKADGLPLPAGKRDPRFLAHTEPFFLHLKFDRPLTELAGRPVLVIDGWVEYPYSQTMFASWQAGASYAAPTLEARAAGGEWKTVYKEFGYPAGMPRQMSLPIEPADLPKGTVELRIGTTMEIYWDRMFIAIEEPCEVKKNRLAMLRANVQDVGFPQRQNGEYRRPFYDYSRRAPLWDTRHTPGYYTSFGEATPLLSNVDDAVAIIGPGEEVEFEFAVPASPDAAANRVFVLECHGWCKDMDLYTEHGESLLPLPRRTDVETDADTESAREELHDRFNTRYRAG